ncbi:hypothetical protein BayCH28_22255 [Mycolicibacterium sp. CH28]|uniref:hypothetical protein n=1 Tax=Mycolicibacterium sp. CH28 TaxID=2512237 RepID=UPI001080AC56|nr:hypothetical protein [Mycolicibacterium sp. CH28]TGD85127.1 hypothetical protein BayCH28_22255 [Mycolicibacterium sp. CH28]
MEAVWGFNPAYEAEQKITSARKNIRFAEMFLSEEAEELALRYNDQADADLLEAAQYMQAAGQKIPAAWKRAVAQEAMADQATANGEAVEARRHHLAALDQARRGFKS